MKIIQILKKIRDRARTLLIEASLARQDGDVFTEQQEVRMGICDCGATVQPDAWRSNCTICGRQMCSVCFRECAACSIPICPYDRSSYIDISNKVRACFCEKCAKIAESKKLLEDQMKALITGIQLHQQQLAELEKSKAPEWAKQIGRLFYSRHLQKTEKKLKEWYDI